jgi:hypothetical protein
MMMRLSFQGFQGASTRTVVVLAFLFLSFQTTLLVSALNIVLPGGSGDVGKLLASKLPQHEITILCRNAFLAAAPNRVTEDFGWVGKGYLEAHPHVKLRDWDGGDLLDIVGCDWMGWQEDTLAKADIVVNLVGGYTEQRLMATERLVREGLRVNPDVLQVTVSPAEEELYLISPGAPTKKKERLKHCEELVSKNCLNSVCLRLEANRLDDGCEKIKKVIDDYEKELSSQ